MTPIAIFGGLAMTLLSLMIPLTGCTAEEKNTGLKTSEAIVADSIPRLPHLQQVGEPSASPRGERFALKGLIIVQFAPEVAQKIEEKWVIQDPEVKKLCEEIGVTALEPTSYQVKVKGKVQPPTIPNLYRLTIPVEQDVVSAAHSLPKNPKILLAKPIYVRLSRSKPQDPKTGLPVAGVISTFPKFEQWNFESEAGKKVTRDFAALSSDPTQPGDWRVENGALVQIRSSTQHPAPSTQPLMHFALLTAYEDHELKIKVKIKPIGGSLYKAGGIVYRFANLENYYMVGLDFLNQQIRFERVVKGVRESLMVVDAPVGQSHAERGTEKDEIASSAGVYPEQSRRGGLAMTEGEGELAMTDYHTLEVVSQGTRCIAFINGQPFINQTDDKLWHGKVGLWTQGDAVTSFDDFTVEAIE